MSSSIVRLEPRCLKCRLSRGPVPQNKPWPCCVCVLRYTLADMAAEKRASARFQPASDQSLLIYFGEKITIKAHEQVRKLLHLLETEPVVGVRNLHPGYCSLLVKFDALRWRHEKLEKELRKHLSRLNKAKLPQPRQVDIP